MSEKMKIFVRPTGLHSLAMVRVAEALERHAPEWAEIVGSAEAADLVVMHVIAPETPPEGKRYAVIQYCGSHTPGLYQDLWRGAEMVWSYYDLTATMTCPKFFLAPLGVDAVFADKHRGREGARSIGVITSGYSTGPAQEAIQEFAVAASRAGQSVVHIGPSKIEGWVGEYPVGWQAQHGINDQTLAMLYRNAKRVSGLRHIEGFELPCLEGLLQGARPVVFDRPDMRRWYEGHAEFVPESHGEELERALEALLRTEPAPVGEEEKATVRARFAWEPICRGFWSGLAERPRYEVEVPGKRGRLLWIGDAGASTGFERSTRNIATALMREFEVHVLGVNYHGDPHDYPFKVWSAMAGGDHMGKGRVKELVELLGPALVVAQTDPWHVQDYLTRAGNVPMVGFVAVDGKNCRGTELNGLAKAVFWTQFALEEARLGGYTGPAAVVPLGVDLALYQPRDRADVRERTGITKALAKRGLPPDAFIVGCVARNQLRKRLDLTVKYFADWVHARKVPDALLWLHSAPTKHDAWDLYELAKAFKVADRVIVPRIPRTSGAQDEETVAKAYAAFDVLFSTTLGEGMWLPGFEAAACGVPIIAPDWSAIGDLFRGAGVLVPCLSVMVHPEQTCTIGGVMDASGAMAALDRMYRDRAHRAEVADACLALARQDRFRWEDAGAAFTREAVSVLEESVVEGLVPEEATV